MSDEVTAPPVARWLEDPPQSHFGTRFGMPWPRGQHKPEHTTFTCSTAEGSPVAVQSWPSAYWPDGSIKWTSHAIPSSDSASKAYQIHATSHAWPAPGQTLTSDPTPPAHVQVRTLEDGSVEVTNGKLITRFSSSGDCILDSITTAPGNVVAQKGRLVLLSQRIPADELKHPTPVDTFYGKTHQVKVERQGPVLTVIRIDGKHHHHQPPTNDTSTSSQQQPWLPFTLRFYFYANSAAIKIAHTFVFDGDETTTFIRGLGLRFEVPLHAEELYNRHVRFTSSEGGVMAESVQGITGMRTDPSKAARQAQVLGQPTPPTASWDQAFVSRMKWIPTWSDYSLTQLSPDGFTMKKRTKTGHSWVNTTGGTRAGGLAYLGGANKGGIALGHREFWERYPTGIDISNAAQDVGTITNWLYSPAAEPMDLRQYHDGLQQNTYEDQLDALWMTYEDWEPGLGTSYGVARTNEFFLWALDSTPSNETLSSLTSSVRLPPVLYPDVHRVWETRPLGSLWSPAATSKVDTAEQTVERNLDFLFNFYKTQVSERKWYGFWDYGDIMHTYDEDRHVWRYDIGGYAWDNSELSPDLWLWLYFLHTGRADVYRFAEALTRHTGEVDCYHLGKYKGLGTRHGVQHWSDSCKQARISNALYRKHFYYLSGADERVGDLLEETLETETTFLALDPYRKVRKDKGTYAPDPQSVSISLGTDWSCLAASWLIEWERRGSKWQQSRDKLLASIQGIGKLANGFITGTASLNLYTGDIHPPAQDKDNNGWVQVSHLSAMFGLVETCAEIIDLVDPGIVAPFESAWLEYCYHFNAAPEEQKARFGKSFGPLILRQGHSRLTAYHAWRLRRPDTAKRAWSEFYASGDYGPDEPWKSELVPAKHGFTQVSEATWISTNISALYGLSALQNLALVGGQHTVPERRLGE